MHGEGAQTAVAAGAEVHVVIEDRAVERKARVVAIVSHARRHAGQAARIVRTVEASVGDAIERAQLVTPSREADDEIGRPPSLRHWYEVDLRNCALPSRHRRLYVTLPPRII